MRVIDRPLRPPYVCAIIPGRAQDDRKFVDTGNDMPAIDPSIYVSAQGVEECMKTLGWATNQEHLTVVAERDELRERVSQLEAELRDADRLVQAIDVIESADFRARRKTGRPRKEVAA